MSKSSRETSRRERAAAIQAANARRERNRRVAIVAGIVAVLAVIVAAGFWYSSSGTKTTTTSSGVPVAARDHALVVGPSSAKVKVIVYEDFLCPFCREFELASRDFLHADATKGTVQVTYRAFHLLPDGYSVRALNAWAAVLEGGTPAQALKFHDLLYDKQPYEQAANKPDASQLASWAAGVGADQGAVKSAVDRADPAYVNAVDGIARQAGITSTPTVIVNGKPLTGGSPSAIADKLEQLIANQ